MLLSLLESLRFDQLVSLINPNEEVFVVRQDVVDLGNGEVYEHTGDLGSLGRSLELLDEAVDGSTNLLLVVRVSRDDTLDHD